MKTVLKEICIMTLLCIAVGLVFAIVFYDYIPNNTIPNKVAYVVPDNIKEELNDELTSEEEKPRQITYSVTSSDLRKYESATVYQPGNLNPFQPYSMGNNNNLIIDGEGGTSGGGGSDSSSSGIQYHYDDTTKGPK